MLDFTCGRMLGQTIHLDCVPQAQRGYAWVGIMRRADAPSTPCPYCHLPLNILPSEAREVVVPSARETGIHTLLHRVRPIVR